MTGALRQSTPRTLKVKCATWDQVEAFCRRKVRAGNRLPMRVPFTVDQGAKVSLALELPSKLTVTIEGTVLNCEPAPDGKKAAVVLELSGLTSALRTRLDELVAEGRAGAFDSDVDVVPPDAEEPPAPVPADAPVFELIEPPPQVDRSQVPAAEQAVFEGLERQLKRLKESAAHEVLGVAWDAGVADIRAAYFGLTKQFHPDVFARYDAPPIGVLAQESFIHINRAYDRMRDAAVEAGSGVIAGPALLPHDGWLVADWNDLGEQSDTPMAAPLHDRPSGRAESSPGIAVREPVITEEVFADLRQRASSQAEREAEVEPEIDAPEDAAEAMEQAREMLGGGEFEGARKVLAVALKSSPRNRSLRALYYVASGRKLSAEGDGARAIAQYEAALAHDRNCAEAREALDEARSKTSAGKKGGLFKRLFR